MLGAVSDAERHRASVLRIIALEGPVSRTLIAEQLELSAATVTAITRELMNAGLVTMEGKLPAAGRGRPSELLGVAPGAVALLGVKVMEDHVTWVLADLRGEVEEAGVIDFDPRVADPTARLAALLASVVTDVDRLLLGVGVGVPGTVATADGGRVTSPMFGWDDLPLGAELASALGLPVVVDNDVNTLAIAEHLYGRGRDVADFVTVTLGRGIGLGIFLDGALRRGGRGGAGEIGHTLALPGGPTCDCGRAGCLEAVASTPALLAQARARGLLGDDAGLDDLLVAAAADGAVRELLSEAGTRLGSATADLVNLLAPALVIISGEGTSAWSFLRAAFEAAFEDGVLPVHTATPVVVDPWEDQNWARGAAALVLRSVLSPTATLGSPESAIRTRLAAIGSEAGA